MTTIAAETITPPSELEPDNSARLAIFDAMCDLADHGLLTVAVEELFDRVIGRLRMLVPRELHNVGEREYLEDKIAICVEAGVLTKAGDDRSPLLRTRACGSAIRTTTSGATPAV